MTDITQETATLVTMLAHRGQVSALLRELARRLEARADYHDLSKFRPDEFAGFVQLNSARGQADYGSPEYNALVKDNKTVDLHISRNRHHPGYFDDGIEGMSFVDLIEWVTDIKAGEVYGTPAFEVFEKQRVKLGLDDKYMWLIGLILELFEET